MNAEWLLLEDKDEFVVFFQVPSDGYLTIEDVDVVIDVTNNSGSMGGILLPNIDDTCIESIINKRVPFILLSDSSDNILDVKLLEVKPAKHS